MCGHMWLPMPPGGFSETNHRLCSWRSQSRDVPGPRTQLESFPRQAPPAPQFQTDSPPAPKRNNTTTTTTTAPPGTWQEAGAALDLGAHACPAGEGPASLSRPRSAPPLAGCAPPLPMQQEALSESGHCCSARSGTSTPAGSRSPPCPQVRLASPGHEVPEASLALPNTPPRRHCQNHLEEEEKHHKGSSPAAARPRTPARACLPASPPPACLPFIPYSQ